MRRTARYMITIGCIFLTIALVAMVGTIISMCHHSTSAALGKDEALAKAFGHWLIVLLLMAGTAFATLVGLLNR
jgi:hypothetical protein